MSKAPTKKELSHSRIVGVASQAIRRAGYRGVGVADIMKEAGFTHGGFYAHFESRDRLLVEAMEQAGLDNLGLLTDGIERLASKGVSRYRALVETYLNDSHMERSEHGCVVASLVSEMPRQSDAVRKEACRRVDAMLALVQSVLPNETDKSAAPMVTATMIGALQLARTLGGKAGRKILAQARRSLIDIYDRPSHH
jgi:TetR/AcrR family transcriptional repressor of nem operon